MVSRYESDGAVAWTVRAPFDGGYAQLKDLAVADDGRVAVVGRLSGTLGLPNTRLIDRGTGDAFCAAWLGLYLRTNDLYTSLMYAGRFMYRVVRRTAEERQRELQLIPELPWLQRTALRVTALPFSPQDHAE